MASRLRRTDSFSRMNMRVPSTAIGLIAEHERYVVLSPAEL
jgi:hypothetical protein